MDIAELQGHWRRAWLKAAGRVDHETAVHWMQIGRFYADIRIPSPRPDIRGASALADLGNATLLEMLGAEGFAGEIALDGDICTWNREINWHGAPEGIDTGSLRLERWSELVEEGVNGDYSELWHRTGEHADFAGRFTGDGLTAFLASVGACFVFGFGRTKLGPPAAAKAALAAGERTDALAEQFSEGFVFGRWIGNTGTACLATNPLWEGETVLTLEGDSLRFSAADFFGRRVSRRFALASGVTEAA